MRSAKEQESNGGAFFSASAFGARSLRFAGELEDRWRQKLRWLLAPSLADVTFAVRSALAAGLSLLIAMWMELDSPQWAPLTVWVVAQSSRGESLSKARWRIAGTVLGCVVAIALISAFPQASALFFCALALWIGCCCGLATFLESYRAYGLVLTGFTSAIVATGAIAQPDDVFNVAIARGTYIVLGVVCEAVLAMLFSPYMREQARKNLDNRLEGALRAVTALVKDLITGKADAGAHAQVLTTLVSANSRIEFDALEIGGRTHIADHARAALSYMMVMLARARALSLLGGMDRDARYDDAGKSVPVALMADYEAAQKHIQAAEHPVRGDHFRFHIASRRHALESVENGVRACAGILGSWLVWEVTAWPSGAGFVSFVALVYGLLATRENPIVASGSFFKGACWCAVAAGLYALWVLPKITTPEILLMALMVPMTIGGLAARHASTAGYAFSFNMFFPVLLGPINDGRYDEQSFFNGALCFLLAVLFVGWTYRVVLPFRVDSHMRRTARWRRRRLRALAVQGSRTTIQQWLAESSDSLVRILRNAQNVPAPLRLAYMQDQLRLTSMGMCLITVRDAAHDKGLPVDVRRTLLLFLRKWAEGGSQATIWAQKMQSWVARQRRNAGERPVQEELAKVELMLRVIAVEGVEI
ncbi:FUSC family protein [Acetobacter tropicalis]|uniref:Fusaric acid resistance protein n=1 Tax=Acetobacter tropicalis TaxID=104102 RepID=A0A291PJU1_9PROT|nr:FUSC family protein [Acetobacter tropicalis]ATJ91739.1 fusaric acid resistance protein [Acetobacter tropicalis]